jgi:hypothetical protein
MKTSEYKAYVGQDGQNLPNGKAVVSSMDDGWTAHAVIEGYSFKVETPQEARKGLAKSLRALADKVESED